MRGSEPPASTGKIEKGTGMILGVVLAGGKSARFGSDKALAELAGHTLLARAVDQLSGWCDFVVVAGRETAPAPTLPDWPHAAKGPLGGIAAALHHAVDEGYAAVLSIGVDAPDLPDDLPALLAPPPSYLATQPVVGLWPISALSAIEKILTGTEKHSVRAFAEAIGATPVTLPTEPANINTPADLTAAEQRRDS